MIVGSGYGGAVAAAALAGCVDEAGQPISVCVLERGQEYLAGSFPSRLAEMGRTVRWATPQAARAAGTATGLFDLRIGDDACVLVANGLGGGSLINAGVMAMPHRKVFREARWPKLLRQKAEVDALFVQADALRQRLGARLFEQPPAKTAVLQKLAGAAPFQHLPITVAGVARANSARTLLDACLSCGDCASGCNHNAKDSLDLNLLRSAQHAGARLVTGATVLSLQRLPARGGGPQRWQLSINHTDAALRERQPQPFQLRARRVILAAGTLGSTEILMRSRQPALRFSDQLGRRFSVNGDMIATAHDLGVAVNGVADETVDPAKGRAVGPTITAMIDQRRGQRRGDLVIQDLAVPGPLRRLFEEAVTTADVLNRLVDGDARVHDGDRALPDAAAVDPLATQRSLLVAMIGRDDADGRLHWPGQADPQGGDGLLTVHWPGLRDDPRWGEHHDRLQAAVAAAGPGRVVDNPMWRPLSERMERVFGRRRGPLMTVHPLGGCAMADDVRGGVTDHLGRVFDAGAALPTEPHDGLVVLDGSIVPGSLGINPALTIAVLAQRAIGPLKQQWGLRSPAANAAPPKRKRPPLRAVRTIAAPQPTCIELTEQMRGRLLLPLAPGQAPRPVCVELTLTTAPVALAALMARQAPPEGRVLDVAPGQGRLRILARPPDPVTDISDPADVLLQADVSGRLRIFGFEPTHPFGRALRAGWAWVRNRGLRDGVQDLLEQLQEALAMKLPPPQPRPSLGTYVNDIWHLCTGAGAVRLVEYQLAIGPVHPRAAGLPPVPVDAACFAGQPIRGRKRLTYARCASPWTQLMEMQLQAFPGWQPRGADAPRLVLNPRYLARRVVPLLRVVAQQDRTAALADLVSFALYVLRLVLQVHALSFRLPDPPLPRPAQRLPGLLPGLPPPEVQWLEVPPQRASDGKGRLPARDAPPARIRLARYQPSSSRRRAAGAPRPVLLIHGYSASGTTFAHPALPQGLAPTLVEAGRDVWVLDMRSSAGMPTARADWAFETMAQHDIPQAIRHVRGATGARQVDVVAHCMGAVMLSMALLELKRPDGGHFNKLYRSIGRLVLSQAGPVPVLSPANVLRAYIMRYVRHFLPLKDYAFSPEGERSLADQLLDRLLATMPLPADEYRLENPLWPPGQATPWAGSRRRMDALYARTFKLANLAPEVLAHFDDHFGPLSVETVSQVIHFARFNTATDRTGFNRYVVPQRVQERLPFPMLALHGEDNGLTDVATLQLLCRLMDSAGIPVLNPDGALQARTAAEMQALIAAHRPSIERRTPCLLAWRIAGHGHQDVLIGRQAGEHCRVIADFLA